jgi:RNA polymerase primary sigma factor
MSTTDQARAHAARLKARVVSGAYYIQASAPYAHSEGFGEYLREIGRLPLLASDEERELGEAVKRAREDGSLDRWARDQLVERNLRLAVSVAKMYQGRGVELEDLVQEGNIGLIRAAELYDPDRAAFSTHGVWWIRQAVSRACANQSHTIRRPVHVGEKLARLKRAAETLTQALGRSPSLDELGDALGLTFDQVVALLVVPADPLSLNAATAEDDEREVGDTVPDPRGAEAYERVERAVDNAESVSWALDFLTDRQRQALVLRLGLDGDRRRTLEQTGKLFEPPVTRERVRQIEGEALKRLRTRFRVEDGRLVRRTPAEERAQEAEERRLKRARHAGLGDVRRTAAADLWASAIAIIDSRPAVAS